MGFWNSLKDFLFEDEIVDFTDEVSDGETVQGTDQAATWQSASSFWQLSYAQNVVANILASYLTNLEWKTYKQGELVKGEEWYRLNYAMNNKETAAEFFSRLAKHLILNKEALVIETLSGEFFIADAYSFKNSKELLMKDNTFINVRIGDVTLAKSFKENSNCLYIKAPQNDYVDAIHKKMASDYMNLKELIEEGADKALGMKLNLTLTAQGKNKTDEEYAKKMQESFEKRMKNRNALFVTYKGEELVDLTEKQRGSEVQQVLEAVENNIKVNKEVLTNVGNAYGIPAKIMTGEYMEDCTDIYTMAITMFAKPYIKILQEKFSNYLLEKEDIINGSRIQANLDSIKFVEMLKTASSVDKLISSGYTLNEIREKLGDEPTDDVGGDTRFITRNYAVMSEYVKGEGTGEV